MLIFIRALSGGVTPLNVHPYENVLSVKSRIFQLKGVAIYQQHLLYDGIELPDTTVLALAKIDHGSLLRLMLKMHAAPLNILTTNIPTVNTSNRHNSNCKQPTSFCPVRIPVGHPNPYWNPMMIIPYTPHPVSEQHLLRKHVFAPLDPPPCIFNSQSYSEPDTSLDDVSQLAEYLGYAVDPDVESSSDEGTKTNTENQTRLFSNAFEHSSEVTKLISNANNPVCHLVPVSGSVISTLSHLPCAWNFGNTPVHIIPIPNSDNNASQPIAHEIQRATIICSDETSPQSNVKIPYESSKTECSLNDTPIDSCDMKVENVKSSTSSITKMKRPTADALPHTEISSSELVIPALSCVQIHPYLSEKNHPVNVTSPNSPANLPSVSKSLPRPVGIPHRSKHDLANFPDIQTSDQCKTSPEKRCSMCQKRIKLAAGFSCWCERWFCIRHHHPEDHDCVFDFKVATIAPPISEF